jgi:hypothetical protein
MEDQQSRKPVLPAVLTLLVIAVALLIAFVFFTSSVAGTATLPNGVIAKISGPFGASENRNTTTVDACGRQFVFTATTVSVDGIPVAKIDSSVTQVAIDAEGIDAELSINGASIPLPAK